MRPPAAHRKGWSPVAESAHRGAPGAQALPMVDTDRTLSATDLSRLTRERDAADREYNDALTRLDHAIDTPPEVPHAPEPTDTARLDDALRWLADPPGLPNAGGGVRGWAHRLIGAVVAPSLAKQDAINRALADQLASFAGAQRQVTQSLDTTLTLLRDELEALRTFQSTLVVWAQQITPYVDTKDRAVTGLIRRVNENPVRLLERTMGLIQQRQVAMKRELERLGGETPGTAAETAVTAPTDSSMDAPGDTSRATPPTSGPSSLDAFKYVGFEQAFRGSEADIATRLEGYCDRFAGASDVLDIGCGRGEFLGMLRDRGVTARGLDANREMVAICRDRDLDVAEGDAVRYLESLADASLGGIIATQVVEHFTSDYLLRFLDVAYHKLRADSTIILETLNVDSWSAFFGPYLRDITHERPIPPDTLRFLLEASGFQRLELQFSSPADEAAKLKLLTLPATASDDVTALAQTFNLNVDKMNTLLFTFLDYAVIGQKL
ncbi:MAG TPA: methyltransferase domain-containing protein [Acidobacteria bacterium]|nr:methyltransferase domain-containing protein [Acidobacteriota bacterium]